jgi:hypothetical protein
MFAQSAPDYIVSGLKQGSFNGTVENKHGKDILRDLMHDGKLVYCFVWRHNVSTFL